MCFFLFFYSNFVHILFEQIRRTYLTCAPVAPLNSQDCKLAFQYRTPFFGWLDARFAEIHEKRESPAYSLHQDIDERGVGRLWGHSIILRSPERFFPSNWRIVNSPPASTLSPMGGRPKNKIAC